MGQCCCGEARQRGPSSASTERSEKFCKQQSTTTTTTPNWRATGECGNTQSMMPHSRRARMEGSPGSTGGGVDYNSNNNNGNGSGNGNSNGNNNNNAGANSYDDTTLLARSNSTLSSFKHRYYSSSGKLWSLNHLTAKQHMFLALCRDLSLLPSLFYLFKSIKKSYLITFKDLFNYTNYITVENSSTISDEGLEILSGLVTARSSEYLLCALWCLVSLYLSFATLDSLMVRWIIKYSTIAAILRMFSMSLILITFELLLLNSLSPERDYFLHTWILISCILTLGYTWQSYLNSDLDDMRRNLANNKNNNGGHTDSNNNSGTAAVDTREEEDEVVVVVEGEENSHVIRDGNSKKKTFPLHKKRINLYKITVFCVIPVGIASFLTMLCLMRNLFIQRLDVEQLNAVLGVTL